MTEADCAAFEALKRLTERSPIRCVELGEHLWGTSYRDRQAYCRPAGKVLHRLKREGVAAPVFWRHKRSKRTAESGWLPKLRGALVVPDGISAWEP